MRAQHERLTAFVFAEKVSPRTPRLFVIAAEVGTPVWFGTLNGVVHDIARNQGMMVI
jgi:hypothetical protein